MVILLKNMAEENLFSKLEKVLTREKEYIFDFSGTNFKDDNLYDFIYHVKRDINCEFWYRGLSFQQTCIVRNAIRAAKKDSL